VLDESHRSKLEQLNESISSVDFKSKEEVVQKVKEKVNTFTPQTHEVEYGVVTSLKDGVCTIEGLQNAMYHEILEFDNGTKAIALNLEENMIGAVILGDYTKLKVGNRVRSTGSVPALPVSEDLLGRVIDPLGVPLDNGKAIESDTHYPFERVAPGVLARQPVYQPLQTGIKAIDTLVPIGKGQRELILGDRQTGKTTVAIDTIINQKDSGVISIYVAIGQKISKVVNLVEKLKKFGAMDNTIVVASGASDPAPLLYVTPYAATAIAEYFADKGKDVLIIYDDLSKHAVAYRELSLILRRPPGREAFPGDVFYLHSRLLERSVKLSEKNGGGSITSLPIIETQAGDISAYVPTNVISITDGQIFLESNLFNKGVRPAINVGLSVSRVGGSAQTKAMKKVAGKMKLSLAQFRELEAFSQFSGDLDADTKAQLNRGKKTVEILKQVQYMPLSLADQVISIGAVNGGYFDEVEVQEVGGKEKELILYAKKTNKKLVESLEKGDWSDDIEKELNDMYKSFFNGK
jgi:F-type H+/Na+-transporting ATPase subunit alpha